MFPKKSYEKEMKEIEKIKNYPSAMKRAMAKPGTL